MRGFNYRLYNLVCIINIFREDVMRGINYRLHKLEKYFSHSFAVNTFFNGSRFICYA